MRVRSGGSGGGGGGLCAVSGGGGGEGALGGGDGFGVGQPPAVREDAFSRRARVGRRRVEPAPLREGDRRGQRRRRYDDVYVWMDGCTHDVAVGHVRGVGVVRPRRGGRIHPDASGPVRRVHRGLRRSRHLLPVPYRDGYPVRLIHAGGITRVRASCGRSSALTSHRAACRSRASCAMAETALPR